MLETKESQKLLAATDDTRTITMPEHPDRITFESNEIMIGSD